VFRRSVVYAALTLGVAGLYLAVAAAPGLALGRTMPVELAVLLTIVAAFAFQPLRRRLQALADRFAFGDRVNRYELLTGLGATLEQAVELDKLLPRLAATVRRGLGARWVRVSLRDAERDGWLAEPVGVAGDPRGQAALVVALERGDERVGRIECGEPEARPYTARDRELLVTLARQATSAIANVRLTAQLAQSRARIVAAGDAERRRIERDIHDGVQQQVVALLASIRLARNRAGRGEVPADEVLAGLAADVRELLVDLRELAHGIHPPVLSDRGLVSAVEERVRRLPVPATMHTEPELRTRRLPLAVEGASYYVICEAITNVIKHSGAASADIALCTEHGRLTVDVRDDGVGFDPAARNGGAGITNIRDRVEALGGLLRVDSKPGGGTEVHAELPLAVPGG
jgi:signal transduction histidine kinase